MQAISRRSVGLEGIEPPFFGLKVRCKASVCYNPMSVVRTNYDAGMAITFEAPALKEYVVVLYGGEDPDTITIKATKYSTEDKEDWLVFYGADNEPVAEFPRWNIHGLYLNE